MNKTLEVIADPNAPTIITRRWFAAPPERVWQAWTRPELLRQWMGPRTLECLLYEVDLRVGGGYRFVHRAPDGQEFGFHGEYREIQAPHRLVSTFVFELLPDLVAIDTLTLEAKDGGTLATTHSVHSNMEARDGHLNHGMAEGMSDGYARLDDLLATPRITPFLWFEGDAEGAVAHYLRVFGDGQVLSESRMPSTPDGLPGKLMTITFEVGGQRLIAFNGGPHFKLNEAASLFVPCDTQEQIDRLWEGLCEGGQPGRCGWLKDRWGLSWQIIPRVLMGLLSDPDPGRSGRAMNAMLGMNKLDIEGLQAASAGA